MGFIPVPGIIAIEHPMLLPSLLLAFILSLYNIVSEFTVMSDGINAVFVDPGVMVVGLRAWGVGAGAVFDGPRALLGHLPMVDHINETILLTNERDSHSTTLLW